MSSIYSEESMIIENDDKASHSDKEQEKETSVRKLSEKSFIIDTSKISSKISNKVDLIENDEKQNQQEEEVPSVNTKIKLSRDENFSVSKFEKDQLLFMKEKPNDYIKIVEIWEKDDPQKFLITGKTEKAEIKIDLNNYHEFNTLKYVKVTLINYMNRVFEINLPFNINLTFESVKKHICKIYELNSDVIGVIFKEKRLNNKELSNYKLYKDYNFDKDSFTYVQSKYPKESFHFYNGSSNRKRYDNQAFEMKRYLFVCSKTIRASAILFPKYNNDDGQMFINFKIYQINENPKNFKKPLQKKKVENEAEKYKLDSFFYKQFEDNEFANLISSGSTSYSYRENDRRSERSDDDDLEDSAEVFKLKDELNFYDDKLYGLEVEFKFTSNYRYYRFEEIKREKTFTSSKDSCSAHIYADKPKSELLFIGLKFRGLTLFEK
jgi:hypothetical protein